jgi:hypothetical protein
MMDVADLIVAELSSTGPGGAPFETDLPVKNGLQARATWSFICYIRRSMHALRWMKPWMLR